MAPHLQITITVTGSTVLFTPILYPNISQQYSIIFRPASDVPAMFGPREGAAGVFTEPLEKTVMFLTAPKGQDSAAPSGLSDEDSRRQSLSEEFSRAGGILAFRDS